MDDSRLQLTDAIWDRLAAALAAVKSRAGAPPKQTDRDFIEAVLYLARTGCPWRDLPERFGNWGAVYQRFRRWEEAGRNSLCQETIAEWIPLGRPMEVHCCSVKTRWEPGVVSP